MTDHTSSTPQQQFRNEVSGLPVEEILVLCYSFANKPQRLRAYLDILRSRGGQRAQFASCLLCFDLARQGDPVFQQEFAMLVGTIRSLIKEPNLVTGLVEEDEYLGFIWELLEAQLHELDERFEEDTTVPTVAKNQKIASIDLFSDNDFDDMGGLGLEIEESELQRTFEESVNRFLGMHPELPIYDDMAGFRLKGKWDTERFDRFLLEMDSLRDPIPMARSYRMLANLFLGTHMRSKGFFGGINERKQEALNEGLEDFVTDGQALYGIIGVLNDHHAQNDAWEKIAEILTDFILWMGQQKPGANNIHDYDAVGRQIARDRHTRRGGNKRRSKRS